MKIVLGIFIVVLVIAAIVLYILFMLNSRDLICCGDIKQPDGAKLSITRIYTSDLNANETLSEIVNAMNDNEEGRLTSEEMTELLATYQNIIYAPVFTYTIAQEDTNTFSITGSVYNGIDEDGEPTTPDFRYKNLGLTVAVPNGYIIAAQNVYDDIEDDDGDGDVEVEFIERKNVIDPVLLADHSGAAFAFRDCDSFRMVFRGTQGVPEQVEFVYTYDVVATNPLNFTSQKNAYLDVKINIAYDEEGRLAPTIETDRRTIVPEEDE